MNIKKFLLTLVASVAATAAVIAKDAPGVITLMNGTTIECADIGGSLFGKTLKYKLASDGEKIKVPSEEVRYFQYFYTDAPTELGHKWRSFHVVSSSKFVKGEIKPSKLKLGWAECLVDAPTSLYLIVTSSYNPKTGLTTYSYTYYVLKEEWGYAVQMPNINKLNKKDVVAFFGVLFENCPDLKKQLDAQGYPFIDSFFEKGAEGRIGIMKELANCEAEKK